MTQNLLLATRNNKKKRELQIILGAWDINLLTLDEVAEIPEIEEDGTTFRENAIKKAVISAELSGCITLADDSGLIVDALGGAPGVYSARFAGPDASDDNNNRKLLGMLRNVPKDQRTARFVCVIAVASPDGRVQTVEGVCEGRIGTEHHGQGGFGYDPLFIPAGYLKTFAELTDTEKNMISHRGRALAAAKQLLQDFLRMVNKA
jgi:non-canonical purine NTP pyrophosphatase, rdgB/HAM1 family